MASRAKILPWAAGFVVMAGFAAGAAAAPTPVTPVKTEATHVGPVVPTVTATTTTTAKPVETVVGVRPGINPGVLQLATSVSGISPFVVEIPHLGQAGTTVTVKGVSLKKGATVQFGNGSAVVAADVAADGLSLKAQVPLTATPGQASVIQDGKTYPVNPGLNVNTWRNKNGYSFGNFTDFQNMVGGWSFQDLIDIYGSGAVQACGTIPLTSIRVCIDDPSALAYLGIVNLAFTSGQCFGFVQSSLRLQNGQRKLSDFQGWSGGNDPAQAGPPADVWHLKGPNFNGSSNIPANLSHFIHLTHLTQTSTQFLAAFAANTNLSGNKDTFRNAVKAAIGGGQAGIISLQGACGHVVQPFDVVDAPDGSYDIWVYDPNVPYQTNENTPAVAENLRIRVDKNGQYNYDNRGNGSGEHCWGSLFDLRVFSANTVPLTPTPPTLGGALDAIVHAFGSAGVSQITDAQGKTLLAADGTDNKNAATRIPNSAVFVPHGGLGKAAPLYILNGHGPYKQTITGKSSGTYKVTFVAKDFTATLENPSQAGGNDELTIDQAGASAELKTVTHAKQVKLTTIAHGTNKLPRTAVVTTSTKPNESVRLAFDAAHETVSYTHLGSPTTFTMELSSVDAGGKANKATSSGISVEKGDVITFKPVWHQLAPGLPMHLKKANGKESDLQMK